MTPLEKYEKVFLEQALIGYPDFRNQFKKFGHPKEQALYKRRRILDKQFVFTPSIVKRLDEINKLLGEKELWAYQQGRRLEKFALKEQQRSGSLISDFMIEFEVALFSEKKYKHIEEMEGQPFYVECSPMTYFMAYKPEKKNDAKWQEEFKENERWQFKENHNEYQYWHERRGNDGAKPHPLHKQHHCWLFHQLYDHTFLAWQDLLDIEMIWVDVDLIIQNGTKIKGKKYGKIIFDEKTRSFSAIEGEMKKIN